MGIERWIRSGVRRVGRVAVPREVAQVQCVGIGGELRRAHVVHQDDGGASVEHASEQEVEGTTDGQRVADLVGRAVPRGEIRGVGMTYIGRQLQGVDVEGLRALPSCARARDEHPERIGVDQEHPGILTMLVGPVLASLRAQHEPLACLADRQVRKQSQAAGVRGALGLSLETRAGRAPAQVDTHPDTVDVAAGAL